VEYTDISSYHQYQRLKISDWSGTRTCTWIGIWSDPEYWLDRATSEHWCHKHSLMTTRSCYCNGLLYVLPNVVIIKIRCTQNTTVRLINRTISYTRITSILKELHRLTIRYRVEYKIFKYIHFYVFYNIVCVCVYVCVCVFVCVDISLIYKWTHWSWMRIFSFSYHIT